MATPLVRGTEECDTIGRSANGGVLLTQFSLYKSLGAVSNLIETTDLRADGGANDRKDK